MLYLRSALRCSKAVLRSTHLKPQDCRRSFALSTSLSSEVNLTFVRANGEKLQTKAKVGESIYDAVTKNKLDIQGFGACEGTLTCSTCHIKFKEDDFAKLPDKAGDEELDMLDMASELSNTSRLGCQIVVTKDMDGLELLLPATIGDARVMK